MRKRLLTGLAIIAPLYLTFVIFRFVLGILAEPLSPLITMLFQKFNVYMSVLPWIIHLIAVFSTLALFYVVGLLGNYFLTRKVLNRLESVLFSIPMVQPIYHTVKQMVSLFTDSGEHIYKKVVSVKFPNEKTRVIGFITGSKEICSEQHLSVFVPTSPNPTSGYLLFVKPSDAEELDISVEDALKTVVSVGIMEMDNWASREDPGKN